jgi:hypothetical protein
LAAVQEARGKRETAQRQKEYDLQLESAAERLNVPVTSLSEAVERRFLPWLKAQRKYSTLPRKA